MAGFALLLVGLLCPRRLKADDLKSPAAADWPVYRHDLALSGATPAKGHAASRRELWSVAAPGTPIIADVDGNGWAEVVAISHDGKLRIIGDARSISAGLRGSPPLSESPADTSELRGQPDQDKRD